MNKVSIVGHPACGLQQVETLLRQCGMQPPLPSRRDGMTPHDIARALIKAYQCEPVDVATDEATLSSIEVGPVWHGMALDLLLGNLDQPFWGWADPNTIYLLDYWRTLDPQIVFVLVYDHPRSSLRKWAEDQDCIENATNLRKPLDNWSAYNGALLRFYLRHPDRCVLVSVDQMHHTVDAYLQQMGQKLRRPLALGQPNAALQLSEVQSLPTTLQAAAAVLGTSSADLETLWQVPEVEEYLIDDVLHHHPAALQLYEELQSSASLPPVKQIHSNVEAVPAWHAFLRHRNAVASTLAHLLEVHERSAAQVKDLLSKADAHQNVQLLEQQQHEQTKHVASKLEQDNSQLKKEIQTLRHKLEQELKDAASRAERQTPAVAELKEENELLLNQLHQVQEELESYYLENQKLKASAKPSKPRRYGAADRIKQQLTYRLGARVIQQNQTFLGKVWLLPALWSEARAFKREQGNRADHKQPPIHQYADAHEAERVKQHLSYRLGQVVRRTGYNPLKWPMLPFALHAEKRAWKRERGEV